MVFTILGSFALLLSNTHNIIWLFNRYIMSLHVSAARYSKNVSCALNLIHCFKSNTLYCINIGYTLSTIVKSSRFVHRSFDAGTSSPIVQKRINYKYIVYVVYSY